MTFIRYLSVALFVCSVLAAPAATAQALQDIETDRPDQTETATTVSPGSVQIEAGLVYEHTTTEHTVVTIEGASIVLDRGGE